MEHKIILTYENIADYIEEIIQICNISPCRGGYNVEIMNSKDENGKKIKAFLPMPFSFIPRSYLSNSSKHLFIEAKFYSINVEFRKIRVSRLDFVESIFTFKPALFYSDDEYKEQLSSYHKDKNRVEKEEDIYDEELSDIIEIWDKIERELPDYYVLERYLKPPMTKEEYESFIKPIFITNEDRNPEEIEEIENIGEIKIAEDANNCHTHNSMGEEHIMWALENGYEDYV
ncbi:MAG: hypothetical protein K2M31_03205 [Muribaculaceae bacterium]|nr:hypothetical protein [Muribaculaceae bacterium]